MSFPSYNPTKTKSWQALTAHFEKIKDVHMNAWFEKNPNRIQQMTINWDDFYVDFSKNRLDIDALKLLLDLAEETKLPEAIEAYFSGEKINKTENRAVLHTALRNRQFTSTLIDGEDVMPEVKDVLKKMETFSDSVINGELKGYTGKSFDTIVN
ncbi:MAG: glucose-6-phosphate isomerase, partial [Flavobacteriaceae bacterium]|nr:glucose-6-phosphate isomerase [Flavobacteriaceae bacterium]